MSKEKELEEFRPFVDLLRKEGIPGEEIIQALEHPEARVLLLKAIRAAISSTRPELTVGGLFTTLEAKRVYWSGLWENLLKSNGVPKPPEDLFVLSPRELALLERHSSNPFVQVAVGFSTGDQLGTYVLLRGLLARRHAEYFQVHPSANMVNGVSPNRGGSAGWWREIVNLQANAGMTPLDARARRAGHLPGFEVLCLALDSPEWIRAMGRQQSSVPGVVISEPSLVKSGHRCSITLCFNGTINAVQVCVYSETWAEPGTRTAELLLSSPEP